MTHSWTQKTNFSRYSQNTEGTFLTKLVGELGLLDGTAKNIIDFGAGDGFKLSNVRHFQEDFQWNLHLFDYMDVPGVHKEFITRDNVSGILDKHKVPAEIHVMSLDLDGNDYWIWKSFFEQQSRRPMVIVTEYNLNLDPKIPKTIAYNESHTFQSNDYYGASQSAFELLFKKYNYTTIAFMGDNMFFLRSDLATPALLAKIPKTTPLAPRQVWAPSKKPATAWVVNPPI